MVPNGISGGPSHSSSSSGIFFQANGQSHTVSNSYLSSSFGNSSNSIPQSHLGPFSGDASHTVLSSGPSVGASSLVTDANSNLSGGGPYLQRSTSINTDSHTRLPASPLSFSSNNMSLSGSSVMDGSSMIQQNSNQDSGSQQLLPHGQRQQGASSVTSRMGQFSLPSGPRGSISLLQDANMSHLQKKPRLDIKQEDIIQQHLVQQLLQRQDSMQNPQLQALIQQQRLRQEQQQILQAMPPAQRADLLQQQQQMQLRQQLQQQSMQPVFSLKRPNDNGVCSRRLMQYLYHQRQRPPENTIAYWRKFVSEYFSPRAKKRWCLSSYENAEDVFQSLAVPLMKLVGLKTAQNAEKGRFDTIVIDKDFKAAIPIESQYEEEGYMPKATLAGKELVHTQTLQIKQLIRLLKQIETQVNSSHSNIFQTISDHRNCTQMFFRKMMAVLAAIHQTGTGPSHDAMAFTVKLLRATFERINLAFDSVEEGVETLVYNLGDQMCAPMTQYVKSLKAEMTAGPLPHLLTIVEKMGGELRNRQLKLEQERSKAREAEDRKLEALRMLKKSEDNAQKMKDYLNSIVADRNNCINLFADKVKGTDQVQDRDEGLLWELLNKKRKHQQSDSPIGPQELHCIGFHNYNKKSKRVTPQPLTRSNARSLTLKTPCSDSRLLLGSSPSVVTQKVLTRKRITR